MREKPSGEELGGCCYVAFRRNEHVNDLAFIIYGPIDVAPYTCDFHVCLVDKPSTTNRETARPGGVDE